MKRKSRSIDFQSASHEELDEYGMQLLVYDAPELSVILRGHLLIERAIEALIARELKHPEILFDSQRVSFEMKVELARSLGVIPITHVGAAKALNKIRNSYAHSEDYQLSIEELNSLKIQWAPIQKKAYAAACTKGIDEAARIALIFLNWSFLHLLHPVGEAP